MSAMLRIFPYSRTSIKGWMVRSGPGRRKLLNWRAEYRLPHMRHC